ncbi:HNH endonuclease [Jiangella anatolica]|uniref:HNH endonuclease n=1 Tax=Jiangella anatolica TaxID=2670374 RepID=A0A2W2CBS7_9ACTN|nr:HNH endonuclease [Jiangella anatolica]
MDDCWEWIGSRDKNGYGRFFFEGLQRRATHASLIMFKGERVADGLCARHACDNPPCVNPAHLLVGTRKQNTADAVGRRRHAHGEKHGRAKITEDDVREMRRRYATASASELALEFGISKTQVYYIALGRSWRHVDAA